MLRRAASVGSSRSDACWAKISSNTTRMRYLLLGHRIAPDRATSAMGRSPLYRSRGAHHTSRPLGGPIGRTTMNRSMLLCAGTLLVGLCCHDGAYAPVAAAEVGADPLAPVAMPAPVSAREG